jgi:O-antigen/teichoic acid export membrane protein
MFKNVGSNWIVAVANIGVTYVLLPFVIHILGKEGYGSYVLIASITGYLGLLALGVPMTLVRYLAEYVSAKDQEQINRVIGSCAGMYLSMGVAATLVGGALYFLFRHAYAIPAAWVADARLAFFFIVLNIAFSFVGLLPDGILAAHHDFVARNVALLVVLLLRLGLTLWLLELSASISLLAFIQFFCTAAQFGILWTLVKRRYPGTRLSLAGFDWSMVRQVFSFSVFVFLLQMGSQINFETDSMVIGAFMNVGQIPYYAVANNFLIYLVTFMVAIASVVLPMTTKLQTENRMEELREVFLKWSKVAFSVSVVAGAFLLVLGPEFIGWWIGPTFRNPAGHVLQILMVGVLLFLPARGVAQPLLVGLGKPKLVTYAFLITSLVNLGLSIALAGPLGLAGVAIGTALPIAAYSLVTIFLACRETATHFAAYFEYVVSRAVVGTLPVVALLLWFKLSLQVEGFRGLLAAGLAMLSLFALIWALFVYRKDPYFDLEGRLARLLAWNRA